MRPDRLAGWLPVVLTTAVALGATARTPGQGPPQIPLDDLSGFLFDVASDTAMRGSLATQRAEVVARWPEDRIHGFGFQPDPLGGSLVAIYGAIFGLFDDDPTTTETLTCHGYAPKATGCAPETGATLWSKSNLPAPPGQQISQLRTTWTAAETEVFALTSTLRAALRGAKLTYQAVIWDGQRLRATGCTQQR
jgi:hypothetical protein